MAGRGARSDGRAGRPELDDRYATGWSGQVLWPFSLRVEHWRHVLVLPVHGDARLAAVEVQRYDDDGHGRGTAVLLHRRDGRVDGVRTRGLAIDPAVAALGTPVATWEEADLGADRVAGDQHAVDVHVVVRGRDGDRLRLRAAGVARRPGPPLDVVTAAGGEDAPLLVRLERGHLLDGAIDVRVEVDGRGLAPATLPRTLAPHRTWSGYHAASPVVAAFGAAPAPTPLEPAAALLGATSWDLCSGDGHPEVGGVSVADDEHAATLRLAPGLPDLLALREDTGVQGRWALDVDHRDELARGRFEAVRTRDRATLEVRGGGAPRPAPTSRAHLLAAVLAGARPSPVPSAWSARVELPVVSEPSEGRRRRQ